MPSKNQPMVNLSTSSVASSDTVVARSLERVTWPSSRLFLSFCSEASSVLSWALSCSAMGSAPQNGADVVQQLPRQVQVGFRDVRQGQVDQYQAGDDRHGKAQREQVHGRRDAV